MRVRGRSESGSKIRTRVTSYPTLPSSPPNNEPTAPAPTTRTRFPAGIAGCGWAVGPSDVLVSGTCMARADLNPDAGPKSVRASPGGVGAPRLIGGGTARHGRDGAGRSAHSVG